MARYRRARSRSRKTRRNAKALRHYVYSPVQKLAREAIEEKFQEALEAERDELVGRARYERLDEPVYRNGYHKPRQFVCGCGTVQIQVPRLEKAYESQIVPRYERMTPEMKALLPELYLQGLSTGDFEPALGWLLGEGAPLSPTTIVRLKQKWEEEYHQWKQRPLEGDYLYAWADGIYPKGGPLDESLCLLVVVGVTRSGRKEVLALAEGYRESEESWKEVFRDLKKRGVKWIGLVIGDGMKGLWKAVRECFPRSLRQRCWVHKMRNILDKVPDKVYDEILAALREIYHAKSEKEARALIQAFVDRYRSLYPRAVRCLQDDIHALSTYFCFPRSHWKSIKTTNPIESLFSAVKLRSKAARRLRTRVSAVCLVFQVLRNSERRIRSINGHRIVGKTIDAMKSKSLKVRRAA